MSTTLPQSFYISRGMSPLPAAVHVYQPGNIPGDAEDTESVRYLTYGDLIAGITFRDAFIHDEPVNPQQIRWITEVLLPRVKPGGMIKHLGSQSLRDTSKSSHA